MNDLHAAALDWHTHGFTVVPVATDGTKRPAIAWKTYLTSRPTDTDITAWFSGGTYDGLGIICGATSGNLEMLEVEGRATHLVAELTQLMNDNGAGDLWNRLCTGYMEQSPSGGMHWLYRVDGPARPNTKLARRPKTDGPGVDVLIETRGEGGFTVAAPSAGRTHPTGKPWLALTGTPATVPVITADERDMLHAIANVLDAMPIEAPPPAQAPAGDPLGLATSALGTRPGDDYNERATWDQILGPHGWTKTKTLGRGYGWTRPGKSGRDGISATTGTHPDADRLYVFSSSTEFETEKPYSKFGAYALLEHHGDHSAAAAQLAKDGYGRPAPISPPTPGTRPAPVPPQAVTRGHLTAVPPIDPTSAPAVDGTSALAPQPIAAFHYGPTEDGVARALVDNHHHELRYCPQRGSWLVWNGHRWAWDEADRHRELIRALARELPDGDGWATFKKRALSATGVTGIARLAQSDPDVVVHIDDLDANPYELNTPAGIIDLRTGTLRDSDPAALHTRVTTAVPDFDHPSDVFEAFLADTFPDTQLRAYMARLLGLSAIGVVLENILPFGYGVGANGKTTLYEAVATALGTGDTGYAISAPSEMLMQRRHSEHPAELAQLAGARLVVCSELDDGQKFAEARVKMLTGADSINARFMRGNPFTFKPSHTFHLLGNHKPGSSVGGDAFWRRVQLIPFDHVVPKDKRDGRLGEKLATDAGAILAWVARGAADYLTGGLQVPAIVSEATADYAADQDTIGRFVTEECHRSESDVLRCKTATLREAYEQWCRETGESPVSAKRLTSELSDRFNVQAVKGGKGVRFYTRIALIEHDESATSDTEPGADQGWFR